MYAPLVIIINFPSFFFTLHLQRIEKPFLDAVEQTLGDRYTENVDGIYKVTIKFIIETLIGGFESGSAPNDITSSNSKAPTESNNKGNS